MAETAFSTKPIFEAVVCGLALQQFEHEELKKAQLDFLKSSAALLEKYGEVLGLFSTADFSRLPKPVIELAASGLASLVRIMEPEPLGRARQFARQMDVEYRDACISIVEGIARNAERIEEIAEAWSMALDDKTTANIRQALDETAGSQDAVKDWRESLASIQD